jgi:hypothetical protein
MFSSLLLTQDILTTQVCAHRFGVSHDHVLPWRCDTSAEESQHTFWVFCMLPTVEITVTTSRTWNKLEIAYILMPMTMKIDFLKTLTHFVSRVSETVGINLFFWKTSSSFT